MGFRQSIYLYDAVFVLAGQDLVNEDLCPGIGWLQDGEGHGVCVIVIWVVFGDNDRFYCSV